MSSVTSANPVSRREFLLAISAAGTALLTQPLTAALEPVRSPAHEGEISASLLKAAVGTQFVLHTAGGRIKTRLDKVDEGKSHKQLQQFSAHFSLPDSADQVLQQQLYSLESAALGKMDLLMLPGNEGPTRSLVATFCQLVSA